MSIDFGYKKVAGFDKELLYNQVGYLAKPVTLDKSTLTVTPTEKGRYIIPQGTLLYGKDSSLLLNPNQNAKAVVPTLSKAICPQLIPSNKLNTFTCFYHLCIFFL